MDHYIFDLTFVACKIESREYEKSMNVLNMLTARRTLSWSSSSFCSKTIISDFPCCAARRLKNRLHLTRTSENWSCANTEQFISDHIRTALQYIAQLLKWLFVLFACCRSLLHVSLRKLTQCDFTRCWKQGCLCTSLLYSFSRLSFPPCSCDAKFWMPY